MKEQVCAPPFWCQLPISEALRSGLILFAMLLRIHAMYEAKKQQNLQRQDILACNSANKPSFQNLTKMSMHFLQLETIVQ